LQVERFLVKGWSGFNGYNAGLKQPKSRNPNMKALLVLEDGAKYEAEPFGARGTRTGEVVFNTSMTGYQEILTDPSYHRQIVVMTQPHIGNYGCNEADDESDRAWAAGFVVRSASRAASSWRATMTLDDYLKSREVVALTEVDTRTLVRHIRDRGAMRAAISSETVDYEYLLGLARGAPDMNGLDLAREVTCVEAYHWMADVGARLALAQAGRPQGSPLHVVAYDFGIKRNIFRRLAARGCKVTVVPAGTTAAEVLALRPDGVFLSNGPGDPAAVTYAIENVKQLLGKVPIFGICLGHQILGLALGGTTYKLKFGHRGGNQPVKVNDRVEISSHNHGFAVQAESLPTGVEVSHVNLNDGCVEGLRVPALKAFSVQYHPEASPGPHDSEGLFDEFVGMMVDNG
jgi:carbamoyl-phosphate synthase small subunit